MRRCICSTVPGEVFLRLVADALGWCQAGQADLVVLEGCGEWLLSEGSVRGRDKRNLRFAVLTAGAPRGHAEPGLRDEVIWWQTGDFGQYARFAAAAASRPPPGAAGVRAVIWLIAGQQPSMNSAPWPSRFPGDVRADHRSA